MPRILLPLLLLLITASHRLLPGGAIGSNRSE